MGLLLNIPNEVVKKQIQQEQDTGKGGIYSTRKLELACHKLCK